MAVVPRRRTACHSRERDGSASLTRVQAKEARLLIRFWLHRCAIHVAGLIDHCVVALGLLVALVGLLGALVGLLGALGLLGARRLRWCGAAVLRWCCCAVVGAPAPRPPQRRPHAAPTPLLWPFLWRGLRRLLRWLRLCPLLGRREGRRLRLLARLLRWLWLRPQEMIRRREGRRLRLLLQRLRPRQRLLWWLRLLGLLVGLKFYALIRSLQAFD